ncbi:MAG: hypothetical protein NTY02_19515 [Acidobacteria bacterium]|nr:hypothetical protein [Acidobacteriota bacterium]
MIIQTEKQRNAERQRWSIQEAEEWHNWTKCIPAIQFPADWKVRITPPFNCAIVRFRISLDGNSYHEVSVYLDGYDRIGCYGAAYWEVYPYQDDVGRCDMDKVPKLLEMITVGLTQVTK